MMKNILVIKVVPWSSSPFSQKAHSSTSHSGTSLASRHPPKNVPFMEYLIQFKLYFLVCHMPHIKIWSYFDAHVLNRVLETFNARFGG